MKAETVTGDGTGARAGREETLALAGREGAAADALAGREEADADTPTGQKPAEAHTGREQTSAKALTGREEADADTPTGQKPAEAHTGREQTSAKALTGREEADTDTPTGQKPTEALTGREQTGAEALAGREEADTDTPTGRKPAEAHTGLEDADSDDAAGRERADAEAPAGAEPGSGAASGNASDGGEAEGGSANAGSAVRKAPDGGEPLGADGAPGARTPERHASAKAEAADGDARPTEAGALSREAEPASEEGPADDRSEPVSADAPSGMGGSPAARADAPDAEEPAEPDGAEAEPAPQGADRSSAQDEVRGARAGVTGPKAAAQDGPDDTASARRPSWAKRNDRPEEDDVRRPAAGEKTPDGTTGPQGKSDAPVRRPSWAKGGDRPEVDDAPAGARAPGESGAATPRPEAGEPADGPGGRQLVEGDEAPAGQKPKGADRAAEEPAGPRQTSTQDDAPSRRAPKDPGHDPEKPTGSRQGTARDDAPARPAPKDPDTDRAPDTQNRQASAQGGKAARTAPKGPGAGREEAEGAAVARAVVRADDPERTSEFVALKDPRPAAVPQVLEPTRETPRPPLELLAELTNTAPPPETPRRTLTRRVKVWTPIVLLLGGAVVGAQMLRPLPAPRLVAAQDSVTLDGTLSIPWPAKGQGAVRVSGSGDVATFGEQKPTPTASVAKAMTAYLILKNHPLRKGEQGPQIEIDAQAATESASEDESRIKSLKAGQQFSQREMLEMVMLPSANNIARLLARWDGGSGGEAAFVAKMNAAAGELGMRDTTYTDPSGLNATTVSTAVDQLKLAEAAMQDEMFRTIVATTDKTVKGVEPLRNSNKLLWDKSLGNRGIKTGSSTAAGGTLVWAADKQVGEEKPLILGALMDQHVDGPDPQALRSLDLVLKNSGTIIEAVRKALASTPVIHKGQTVGHVSDGLGGRTPLVATKDLSVIGVPGQKLRLTLGTAGGKSVPHEAKAGTEVAVLTVGDGPGAKTVPVAVGKRLAEPSFGTRVTRVS
ncbi:D-alanyl-D-alanine carboxypeptidase [Streptomyces polychromogenes]